MKAIKKKDVTENQKPAFKILVVDDNPDLIYSVKEGLGSIDRSFEIFGAEGGRACLEFLKKNTVDLVLLDIMMPDMDGWDTCAKIKSNKKTENLPIIFLTAKTDPISKGMGRLASSDYVEKPFDVKDLQQRIMAVLKKKSKGAAS